MEVRRLRGRPSLSGRSGVSRSVQIRLNRLTPRCARQPGPPASPPRSGSVKPSGNGSTTRADDGAGRAASAAEPLWRRPGFATRVRRPRRVSRGAAQRPHRRPTSVEPGCPPGQRRPPRGVMGRGGGHLGRRRPAMTRAGPPSWLVSARAWGTLSDSLPASGVAQPARSGRFRAPCVRWSRSSRSDSVRHSRLTNGTVTAAILVAPGVVHVVRFGSPRRRFPAPSFRDDPDSRPRVTWPTV